ncbi:hypothetical protein ALC57_10582 [Trachymyrmex cornetzi]|uniref:CCHC-type domain-containing protein n=1 Tax=Trachymyrmex cornetzi TaxID=471704 RepID=A0A151J412_9HYME|nr:hypothetical protein ALC57_10582 [Trachymyrmex cornetzi]
MPPPVTVPELSTNRTMSSIPVAQAITLLASQIPTFDGSEDEDVEVWIRRVEHIAVGHGVSESVTLLAATSKLLKLARDWFYMEEGQTTHSWPLFKDAITLRFKRRVPFHVTMTKIENRKWNYSKESFQEYSMQKLKLMHTLSLPERDKIQLIINGISSSSLRATATALRAISINEFLNQMYEITSAFNSHQKKSSPLPTKKKEKSPSSPLSPSKEKPQPKFSRDITCAYCKAKGHLKADCFKLKRKEQTVTSFESSAGKSTLSTSDSKDASSLIGCVSGEVAHKLEISNPVIEVSQINNSPCSLNALIDTGSPVSLIISSTFTPSKLFFGYDQRNHADAKLIDFLTKLAKTDLHYEEERELASRLAVDTTNQLKYYNKVYYDQRHKTPTNYKLGDYVSIRDQAPRSGANKKMKPLYKGPYMISKILDKNRYVVTDIPGFNLTSRPYNSILSPDKLKYWLKPMIPSEENVYLR